MILGDRVRVQRQTRHSGYRNFKGTIQTTIRDQSLSNITCKLRMMRGGTLLTLVHKVKGQGQIRHSVYKPLLAQYRQVFVPNHFQTV